MRIAVSCDHAGLELKLYILNLLAEAEHNYEDFGCYTTESVDYPDFAKRVAEAVANGDFDRGILICETGIGMSIAANKVRGVRAALCSDAFSAGRARQHNDANVLCLSGRIGQEQVREIVETFLTGEFEGGRHLRRLNKISDMES
ncbi:putative sugar phosphate isomerase YwlF [subsurface metagenome]